MLKYLILAALLWWLSDSHPALAAALAAASVICAFAWAIKAVQALIPRPRKRKSKSKPPATPIPPAPRPSQVTYNIYNIHNHAPTPLYAAASVARYPIIDGEVL